MSSGIVFAPNTTGVNILTGGVACKTMPKLGFHE